MVSMEINKTLIVHESDPKMATASQQRPLALLRRPLPPKQDLPPSSFRTGSEAKHSQTDSNYKVSAKSPDVLSAKRLVNVKSTKVVDSTLREVRFHGDVPLPVSSVVKPYKTKGPDPLPPRPPRKPRELPSEAFIKDSYARPPPEFTLKHFLRRLPSRANPDDQVEPMVSEQNFEKLTSWFAANKPHQATVHSLQIDNEIHVPDVTPRVPARQLLIEMQFQGMETSLSPDQDFPFIQERSSTVFPVTPAASKLTMPASRFALLPPIEPDADEDGETPHTTVKTFAQTTAAETIPTSQEKGVERLLLSRDEVMDSSKEARATCRFDQSHVPESKNNYITFSKGRNDESMAENKKAVVKERIINFDDVSFNQQPTTFPGMEVILPSSQPEYFQGEQLPRTSSPFVSADVYDGQMSSLEAVVLNAMMTSSSVLNLRAHFLNRLPDLSSLAGMLTHLNLSFNDLWIFPSEIFQLVNLVSLKLRNNPIKEIPQDIKKLRRLIVLDFSFNLLTSLPNSLSLNFRDTLLSSCPPNVGVQDLLKHLEILDLAYNRLSFIPSNIGKLSCLRELNLEGNQLGAMPVGALYLNIKYLRISNNFTHPLLWRETATNQVQRLGDLSALAVFKEGIHLKNENLPAAIKNIMESYARCDCCDGPMFGPGVRVIKAPPEMFGVKNLPFLFNACTQTCRRQFSKSPQSLQEWMKRNVPLNTSF